MLIEHKLLDVKQVDFDRTNPRIAHFLEPYEDVDQTLLGDALNQGDRSFIELQQAIRTNGGIVNPIIVNETHGRFVAVEGNTRLAIFKKFHFEMPQDARWQAIPSIVYNAMTPELIDAIRLQAHLVGVRNWSPYAKAKYLHTLHTQERLPLSALVDFCGGNKVDVQRNIEAYRVMELQYRPLVSDDDFSEHKFSQFFEAQRPKIKQAMLRAGFSSEHFAQWVAEDKFSPRQELVRQLPKILESQRAREAFFSDGAEAAEKYLDHPAVSKELQAASLPELCAAIVDKISNIKMLEVKDLRERDESVQTLEDALTYLRNFLDEWIQRP